VGKNVTVRGYVEVDTDDVLCDMDREELQLYFEERFSEELFVDHSKTMEVLVDEYFKGVGGFDFVELFQNTLLGDPSKKELLKKLILGIENER